MKLSPAEKGDGADLEKETRSSDLDTISQRCARVESYHIDKR
jgi:hypothetical protein